MKIIQFVVDSLGDNAYLVVEGDTAAVVDPQRDVRPYLASAEEHGARITHVFETHVHNDYISGGRELAALGATIVAPAGAGLEFDHRPVNDGDEVRIGNATLRAVAAPGHTYNHTAYLAIEASGEIRGAFTGGAILMASAGRSDLLGPDHTEELTRLQWETGQRLKGMLPPAAEILPTHGAGSFCSSAGADTGRRGPLADELQRNPLFTSRDYEAFRREHLGSLAPIPRYYDHMAPINRSGPEVVGAPPVPRLLQVDEIVHLAADGVTVVDVRSRQDYVREHIPIAIDIEESGSMLAYAGWLLPFNAPLALVTHDETQAKRVTGDLFRIGFEQVRGYLPHDAWRAADRDYEHLRGVDVGEAARILVGETMPVLDVRFEYEHREQPIPGVLESPVDRLAEWKDQVGSGPVLVVCASGQRATMAASILRANGTDAIPLVEGGAEDLLRAAYPAGSLAASP